jgi:hypothetical protein
MTFRAADGKTSDPAAIRQSLLREAGEVSPGDRLLTYLDCGQIVSRAEAVISSDAEDRTDDKDDAGDDS